jgi:hypothetical protein
LTVITVYGDPNQNDPPEVYTGGEVFKGEVRRQAGWSGDFVVWREQGGFFGGII